MADIDLGTIAESEIAKRDRKIASLQKDLAKAQSVADDLRATLGRMAKAKDALLECADWLDPFRYDDD